MLRWLSCCLTRFLFRPTQWAVEINAAAASMGFVWLVGESELRSQAVEVAPGVTREQRSVVHIKKCRYLESSGCVGLCVNMCKVCRRLAGQERCGEAACRTSSLQERSKLGPGGRLCGGHVQPMSLRVPALCISGQPMQQLRNTCSLTVFLTCMVSA